MNSMSSVDYHRPYPNGFIEGHRKFFSIAVRKSCHSPKSLNPWGTNGRKSVGRWGNMLGFTVGPDRGSRKIDLLHGVLRERFFLEWDGGRCRFDW